MQAKSANRSSAIPAQRGCRSKGRRPKQRGHGPTIVAARLIPFQKGRSLSWLEEQSRSAAMAPKAPLRGCKQSAGGGEGEEDDGLFKTEAA
jgi:hypothetical protein